ncbi:MAG: T9SS type A sorting domain-containing protein [Bacteroidota bacterium]
MYYIHRLILFIFLYPFFLSAQTYPFKEGFEGLASTQVPPGWGGGMKVLSYHGRNDSKGLSARVSSAVEVDSAITPLIGPITSSTSFSFWYRIIDQSIYPSTPTDLDIDDRIDIMASTDGISYQTVFLIDMNSHVTSFNFVKKKAIVTQFAGSSVNFKIRCQFGAGAGYYVDFDTIVVDNDPQLSLEDIGANNQLSIYPNPCSSQVNLQLDINDSKGSSLDFFNSIGYKILAAKVENSIQIPTDNLPDGVYYIQVGDLTRRITRKLLVQH